MRIYVTGIETALRRTMLPAVGRTWGDEVNPR